MPALDTKPAATAVQDAAYLQLGKMGRLKVAFELSNLVRALAQAGIRKRNPDYTEAEATEALFRQIYRVHAHQIED